MSLDPASIHGQGGGFDARSRFREIKIAEFGDRDRRLGRMALSRRISALDRRDELVARDIPRLLRRQSADFPDAQPPGSPLRGAVLYEKGCGAARHHPQPKAPERVVPYEDLAAGGIGPDRIDGALGQLRHIDPNLLLPPVPLPNSGSRAEAAGRKFRPSRGTLRIAGFS